MPTRFGEFEINEHTRELRLGEERIILQPQVFDVLEYLVRHRHRVVSKAELLNTLWPDVIVTDASLQRAISLIRAALRPGGWAQAIQTRARLGYRFLLEENPPGEMSPTATAEPSAGQMGPWLLEREASLVELANRFRRARTEAGQVVLVCGEAGIGKSALLATFLAGAAKGAPVLRGYCDALFTPRAFGAILDIAGQLPSDGPPAAPNLPREELFAQLFRRLQALSAGTIVLLEDLHWADEATLDFVRFLGRRIASTRCLLVATYRDEDRLAGSSLNQAMGDLASEAVSRLRLLPLSVVAVEKLASETGQEAGRVFALSGGNPFLVQELLSFPARVVPETVRDSMVGRLARCSAQARSVCEVIALLPGRAEMDLITRVLGEVSDAVDEATARGVILHEAGVLTYRHELARLAVENVVAPAHARGLHARILAALQEKHADVARLVHHARCAGDRPAVLALAPEAARRAAAVGAHREAAAQYSAALTFADDLPARERAELLEKHAYECYLISQVAVAVESASAALVVWRELGDRVVEGRLLRFLSRQHWFLGDSVKANQFATEAISVLATLPQSRELAMAYSNRSQLAMLKAQVAEAVEYGEKARALACELSDREVECHALNNMGTARLTAGDQTGEAELARSLELALANNFHEHAARAYVNFATCAMRHRDSLASRRYLTAGLNYCEERDLDAWTNYLRAYQARFCLECGEWDQAEAIASRLLSAGTAPAVARIPALVVYAQVHARRGLPGAKAALAEALDLALPTREIQRMGPVAVALAEAAWIRGDFPALIRETDRGLATPSVERYPWIAGELLFWRSKEMPVTTIPGWLPAPYQAALAGDWRTAAAGFAQHEMPYEQALLLSQGDAAAVERAREYLTRVGADCVWVRLSKEKSDASA